MVRKNVFSLSNIRTVLLLLLIQILTSILFLGVEIIVARSLTVGGFGDFSVAYGVAVIAYIICLLGADLTVVNIVGAAVKANNKNLIKSFFVYTAIIITLMSIFYYSIALIGYLVAKYILCIKYLHPIFVAVIFIPIMAISFFFYKVLIAILKPILANFIFRLLLTLSMLVIMLIMFVSDSHYNSSVIILLVMLPWIVICLIFFIIIVRKLNIFKFKAEKMQVKEWTSTGLSGLPYNLVIITISYLGVIGAEITLADEKMVGIFAIAAFCSQLVSNNIVTCIQSLVLPNVVVAIHDKSMTKLRSIIIKNVVIMALLGGLMILVVLFYGREILSIYGQEYPRGNNIFIIFMLIQSVVWIGFLSVPILLYLGKNKFVIVSSILLILLLVIFISVFGYIFQALGIAYGILFVVVLIFMIQTLYAYKLTYR